MSQEFWRRSRSTVFGALATTIALAGAGLVVATPASATPVNVAAARTCGPLNPTTHRPGQSIDLTLNANIPDGPYHWAATIGGASFTSSTTTATSGTLDDAVLTTAGTSTLATTATEATFALLKADNSTYDTYTTDIPAITCAAVPTVTATKASFNDDKSQLTVWFDASGLASGTTFDVTATEQGGGTGSFAKSDADLSSGKVVLAQSTAPTATTPTFAFGGTTHAPTDATVQAFGPSNVTVSDGSAVTLSSPVASWVACGTSLNLTYSMSNYLQGHKYQASLAVLGGGTATGPAPATGGTTGADPVTITQKFTSATTLPTTGTTMTLTVTDTSASPTTHSTLAGITLPVCSAVSADLPAGGSLSSDVKNAVPSSANPLIVAVTTPVAGVVSITKGGTTTAVPGWTSLGMHAAITAPKATAAKPLTLTFTAYAPKLPAGTYPSDVGVLRNNVLVRDCAGSSTASPDPCVSARSWSGTTMSFTVLTSEASTWDLQVAHVSRLAGADRYGTAIAISTAQFADKGASAVVLATGTNYPDALVGAPLAKAKDAPLLLTKGSTLLPTVKAEIVRALPAGSTVYLVGGAGVIPTSVQTQLVTLGYQVTRTAGHDRYATATAVATALGNPTTVLLATGTNFPDALTAGVGAAKAGGAVLLTKGTTLPDTTLGYLNAHHGTTYAVGGPAASAYPSATALVGTNRYTTSTKVAGQFFTSPTGVGFAVGADYPDALSGGAMLARSGSPLILTAYAGPTSEVSTYLTSVKSTVTSAHLFGGTGVISSTAQNLITTALGL